jgi:PAS domain S-box-containing protein
VIEKALASAGLDLELLEGLEVAVVVTDVNGRIFLWNRAAERLYGYPRDRMLGADVIELFVRPEDVEHADDIMETVLAGRTWTGTFRVRCGDGSSKLVRITDAPLQRDGVLVGVVGYAEEVGAQSPPGAERDLELLRKLGDAGLIGH